mmetsp:Transcript_7258/g.9195  ORF Transcript_7258/g.9195 Transcript_7258/m.9195 type:complete len:157 (+) Transcript_7258:226-696(+)
MAGNQQQQNIDISSMPPQQLQSLRNQLQDEIQSLGQNLQRLRLAQAKFKESKKSVENMKNAKKDNKIMIPLTSSIYVPGRLAETEKVTIEVGTGFFVKRPLNDAVGFIERKLKFLDRNIDAIEAQVMNKRQNLESVVALLNYKVQQLTKQQPVPTK